MDVQLEAQERARKTAPRSKGLPYRVAHVDGTITNHQTFHNAIRTWKFGDVVYVWQAHDQRWAIWTSAGLL